MWFRLTCDGLSIVVYKENNLFCNIHCAFGLRKPILYNMLCFENLPLITLWEKKQDHGPRPNFQKHKHWKCWTLPVWHSLAFCQTEGKPVMHKLSWTQVISRHLLDNRMDAGWKFGSSTCQTLLVLSVELISGHQETETSDCANNSSGFFSESLTESHYGHQAHFNLKVLVNSTIKEHAS